MKNWKFRAFGTRKIYVQWRTFGIFFKLISLEVDFTRRYFKRMFLEPNINSISKVSNFWKISRSQKTILSKEKKMQRIAKLMFVKWLLAFLKITDFLLDFFFVTEDFDPFCIWKFYLFYRIVQFKSMRFCVLQCPVFSKLFEPWHNTTTEDWWPMLQWSTPKKMYLSHSGKWMQVAFPLSHSSTFTCTTPLKPYKLLHPFPGVAQVNFFWVYGYKVSK
jgi:hypothetical protein